MSYLELPAVQNIEKLTFIQDLLYHSLDSSLQPSNPLFQSKFSLPSRDSADSYTLFSMISLLSHPMKWQFVLRIVPWERTNRERYIKVVLNFHSHQDIN